MSTHQSGVVQGSKVGSPWTAALCLGAVALAFGGPARATVCCLPDLYNGWDVPTGNASSYELDFQGDVTNIIPQQVSDYTLINPWAAMPLIDGSYVLNPTQVFFDPGANLTRVVLSGNLPLPVTVPPSLPAPHYVTNGHDSYHTGMDQGWTYNAAVQLVSRHWNYDDNTQVELDSPHVTWTGQATRKTKALNWLVSYVRTVDSKKHPQSGAWSATAYDPASTKPFIIKNDTDRPMRLDSLGYIAGIPAPTNPECQANPSCDENLHMLGSLSAESFPPPGDPGSQFIVLKAPKSIAPHSAFKFRIH